MSSEMHFLSFTLYHKQYSVTCEVCSIWRGTYYFRYPPTSVGAPQWNDNSFNRTHTCQVDLYPAQEKSVQCLPSYLYLLRNQSYNLNVNFDYTRKITSFAELFLGDALKSLCVN